MANNMSDNIDEGCTFEDAARIEMNKAGVDLGRVRYDVDIWPPKKAIAHMLILPSQTEIATVLLYKASWRERWKQFDRDAMLIEQNIRTYLNDPRLRCRIVALHHREYDKPGWNRSRDVAEVQKKSLLFSPAISDAFNTSQQAEINELFADIAGY